MYGTPTHEIAWDTLMHLSAQSTNMYAFLYPIKLYPQCTLKSVAGRNGNGSRCLRHVSSISAKASPSSRDDETTEANEDKDVAGKQRPNNGSQKIPGMTRLEPVVRGVRRKIKRAQTRYKDAAEDARHLQNSTSNDILGTELDGTSLGSRSTIQDLPIPAAPHFADMKAAEVSSSLTKLISSVEHSQTNAEELSNALRQLLRVIRLAVSDLTDAAGGTFSTAQGDEKAFDRSIPAFLSLLQLAKFHCTRPAALSPESVDALPLKISVSNCLDEYVLKERCTGHPLLHSQVDLPEYFPHLLVATRGTGVDKKAGLLLGAKFRAIEEEYLSWAQAPLHVVQRLLENIVGGKSDEKSPPRVPGGDDVSEKVRRVFPSVKLNGWNGISELLLPVFTQEPTHSLCVVAYREYVPDLSSQRTHRRRRALEVAQATIAKAIDPVRYRTVVEDQLKDRELKSSAENEKNIARLPGDYKPFRAEMFGDIPWGNISHYFPSCAVKVSLQSRELLKLDLLTLAGVASCLITAVRNIDKAYIALSVTGTLVAYIVRIAFRLRAAFRSNRGFLAEEKARHFAAANEAVVARVAGLAADEQFAIAASCLASVALAGHLTPSDIQKRVFSKTLSTDQENAEWLNRLGKWGFIRDSTIHAPSNVGFELNLL